LNTPETTPPSIPTNSATGPCHPTAGYDITGPITEGRLLINAQIGCPLSGQSQTWAAASSRSCPSALLVIKLIGGGRRRGPSGRSHSHIDRAGTCRTVRRELGVWVIRVGHDIARGSPTESNARELGETSANDGHRGTTSRGPAVRVNACDNRRRWLESGGWLDLAAGPWGCTRNINKAAIRVRSIENRLASRQHHSCGARLKKNASAATKSASARSPGEREKGKIGRLEHRDIRGRNRRGHPRPGDRRVPIPDGAWPHAGQVTKLTLTERSWTKGSTRWAVGPTAVQSRRPGHALYVIARANRGQGPGTSYAGIQVPVHNYRRYVGPTQPLRE